MVGRLVTGRPDRRAFLARLAAVGAAAPATAWAAACARESPEGGGAAGARDSSGAAAATVTRPVLRPWADDIVHLLAPPHELPVAYVSMARRHVYVDHDHRDRAAWLLGAHISVSTALWRIPLPGDPDGQPVVPGDEAREFEELPLRSWDPTLPPAIDDIRLLRGVAFTRRVELACVPVLGGEESRGATGTGDRWVSAAPLEVTIAAPVAAPVAAAGEATPAEVHREDFRIVGTGLRFDGRECLGTGDAIQLVSWAIR